MEYKYDILGVGLTKEQYDYFMLEQLNGGKLTVVDNNIVVIYDEAIKNKKRIDELKSLLASQDYKTIKYMQGELSEEEFSEVKKQCKLWRDEINLLEKSQ